VLEYREGRGYILNKKKEKICNCSSLDAGEGSKRETTFVLRNIFKHHCDITVASVGSNDRRMNSILAMLCFSSYNLNASFAVNNTG